MPKKQLTALFFSILVPWTIGNGLLPLLPIYAAQLDASPSASGFYLSLSYLSLALGTFFAGWLSDKLQRRKLLVILFGVLLTPIAVFMGAVNNITQLTILTCILWFLGGNILTLINILTGLFAGNQERGKIFGVMALAGGLGSLIGGLAAGPIADQWGFSGLFIAIGAFTLLLPFSASFLEDRPGSKIKKTTESHSHNRFEIAFYIFLLASIFAGVALFASRLGTSLVMKDLLFTSSAISSTAAVGGLVTMPLSLYIGILSDRFGRLRLLGICFLFGALGIGFLPLSNSLWQFWLTSSLISIMAYVSPGVGSALVTDLADPEVLGRAMSYFNATTWIGGIAGFATAGIAFQQLGQGTTLYLAALLPLIGVILLVAIRKSSMTKNALPTMQN